MLQAESAPHELILQASAATVDAPMTVRPERSNNAPLGSAPATLVTDAWTRRLYVHAFGVVYLIAFLSLWSQVHGLIGQQGILPADDYFKLAQSKLGHDACRLLPSFCWVGSNDIMLHVWCATGVSLSALLMAGFAPRPILVSLWAIYLSLSVAGQAFLSFQWDTLLLEMTVCSLLYVPRGWRMNWLESSPPLPAARWLLWGLAFKLLFLSGATKLLSGDTSWNDGTALRFHYYTQPIPNWLSWYAYQLPLAAHQVALMMMFTVEIALPFLIFFSRIGRAIFGVATILLMLAIEATGNFGFFNLQTIVLCLPLLNDKLLGRLLRFGKPADRQVVAPVTPRRPWRVWVGSAAATAILFVSTLTIAREMVRTQQPEKMPRIVVATMGATERYVLTWAEPTILQPLAPFRTINGYGLFRVMTTSRPEIVVEISDDGHTWDAYELPYKPGRVDRVPPIVAPHMPRLDWQMWFAGLNPRGNEYWLAAFSKRILEGTPAVARLAGNPKLGRDPPRYVRLAYYEYKFSSADQRRATGAWWSRSHVGYLTEPLTRSD